MKIKKHAVDNNHSAKSINYRNQLETEWNTGNSKQYHRFITITDKKNEHRTI